MLFFLGSQTQSGNSYSGDALRPSRTNKNGRETDVNPQTLRPSINVSNNQNNREYDRDFSSNSNRRPFQTTTSSYFNENTRRTTSNSFNYDDYNRQPTTTQYPARNNRDKNTNNFNYDDYGRETTTQYPNRNSRTTTKKPGYFSGDLPFLSGETTVSGI